MTIKLQTYMPKRFYSLAAPVSTTVQADDDANPTNWQDVFDYTTPADLPGGANTKYEIVIDGSWQLDSVSRSGLFRVIVNGVSSERLLIEPKDTDERKMAYVRMFLDLPADGTISVQLQFLVSNAGSGTPTLTVNNTDCTIERWSA